MKNKIIAIALLIISCGLCKEVCAQNFLLTKTILDSIKPNTFHGNGKIGFEFKQSDSQSFNMDFGATMFVPTDKHQFKLSGNFIYDLLDDYSNDNKGFACINAMLFQFKKTENGKILEKTPYYCDIYASFNYDYVRDLKARVMAGANFVFQPLRHHPHLCVEPGIGMLFSYQNWQVLNPGNGPNTNNYFLADYNAIRNEVLPSGGTVNDYLKISENGTKEQIDARISASVSFFGVWDRMQFETYLIIHQPLMRPFKDDPVKDAEVRSLAILNDEQNGQNSVDSHDKSLNDKCAPEIAAGGSFSVKLWKRLSLVTSIEFFYDAGQLGLNSRNLTYCIKEGVSIAW